MDIEKLIERLKAKDFERDYDCTPFECGAFGLLDDAATALSTFQAENEKLREKIEDARLEGYIKGLGEMSEENEKLRAELEQVTAERDAAIKDIWVPKWISCKNGENCAGCDNWEWRGQKED